MNRVSRSVIVAGSLALALACGARERPSLPVTDEPDPVPEVSLEWESDGEALRLSARSGEAYLVLPRREQATEGPANLVWLGDAELSMGESVDVYRLVPALRCSGPTECNECSPGDHPDDCPPLPPPPLNPEVVFWAPQTMK